MKYINKQGVTATLVRAYELDGQLIALIEIDGKRSKRVWREFVSEFNSLAVEVKK